MESQYYTYMVMLRYYCLPFASPSPLPQSWRHVSQPCRHVEAEPPQGHGAGAEAAAWGGRPKRAGVEESLAALLPRRHGVEVGVSQQLGGPPSLSPAGAAEGGRIWPGSRAGWADGHFR